MGACGSNRGQKKPYEQCCSEVEERLGFQRIQWKEYEKIVSHFGCMGDITETQFAALLEMMKISKKEYEEKSVLKLFFERCKKGKNYDYLALLYGGLLFCQGTLEEKYSSLSVILDPEEEEILSMEDLQNLLSELIGLAVYFVPSQALSLKIVIGKKELLSLSQLSQDAKEKLQHQLFPVSNSEEVPMIKFKEWMLKSGKFSSEVIRQLALKVKE